MISPLTIQIKKGNTMQTTAKKIAKELKKHKEIKIITHIDADGITSGSIASKALEREGIEYKIEFIKQLDTQVIEKLKDENPELVWFTDLGSGMAEHLNGLNAVITDHHVPSKEKLENIPLKARENLFSFFQALDAVESKKTLIHLNPHLFGINGAIDISGAGCTHLVAKALNIKNTDLASLAIVGAIGDLQDAKECKLVGLNRKILEDGIENNVLEYHIDLRFFGRETRPLFKFLQYANDPVIPGLKNKENCINFLQDLGIRLKEEENWLKWVDLTKDEKQKIASEIFILLLSKGFDRNTVKRMIGEVYILINEEVGTELHDAKEFATLLNSCGRYDKAEVGYNVCLGNRDEWFKRAKNLQQGHKINLVQSLEIVRDMGITKRDYIQYFNGKDKIRDSIIGVVAGMILGSKEINPDLPIFAFAKTDEGVKVSARSVRKLVDKGLDLSVVMKETSDKVGGVGGGHNIAAGATIPDNCEQEFLEIAEKIVKRQIGKY